MACLIKLDSKTFLNKFCKEYNPNDFQIVLISNDIKSKNKFENVMVAKELFPSKEVLSAKVNAGDNDFKEGYFTQLKQHMLSVATIVLSVAKYNSNVILLCSEVENEFEYIDILADFIETLYNIEAITFKKLKKKPKLLSKPIDEDIVEDIEEEIEHIKKKYSKVGGCEETSEILDEYILLVGDVGKKKLKKMFLEFSTMESDELSEMSKKEIKSMAIEFGHSLNEKRLKKLIKYLSK